MLCPSCGNENASNAKFCSNCGGPLAATLLSVESPESPSVECRASFFRSLVAGDLGLSKTFWLYNIAASVAVNVLGKIVSSINNQAIWVIVLLYLPYQIAVWLGVWRAADKYKGAKSWKIAAKLSCGLGASLSVLVFAVVGYDVYKFRDMSAGQTFKDCPECPEMVVLPSKLVAISKKGITQGEFGDFQFDENPSGIVDPFATRLKLPNLGDIDSGWVYTGGDPAVDSSWVPVDKVSDIFWKQLAMIPKEPPQDQPMIHFTQSDALQYAQWLSHKAGVKYSVSSSEDMQSLFPVGADIGFHVSRRVR